jgi:hypothetical protein
MMAGWPAPPIRSPVLRGLVHLQRLALGENELTAVDLWRVDP